MEMLDLILQSSSSVSLLGTLVLLLLFCLISSSSFSSFKDGKEPPGPMPLPLVGNLLQMGFKRPYMRLLEFSKKYGSVFTIYMGPGKVVVLAGYKTIKEALVDRAEEFGDRDHWQLLHESNEGHGIIWANGDSWKEMRRFALTNLRDFGMGKKAAENKIIDECSPLIGGIEKFKGQAFDTDQPLYYAVSNIICSMVYGNRHEYSDPVFKSLIDRTKRRNQLMLSPSVQMYNRFPWLCKWIANRKEFHRLGAINRKHNIKVCGHLKETLNPQMCRGFVDAFLVRKQNLEESGITNSHFHNENLLKTVSNLFAAGADTTVTTLRWGLLFMAKNRKIQDQVQEELDKVIGSRQVQAGDRKSLPFTNAVIHETQRLANISPLSLPHKTTQDVTFQGFFIKKGTTVLPYLTSVLYDESMWESPHTFNPAHFLDKEGKFVMNDAFMPFSAGRRVCPGESLARMELFIFFTSLLQHFRFAPPAGVSEEELEATPCVGFNPSAPPHKLRAVQRM